MKTILSRNFVVLLVVLLSFSYLAIFNVKAQQYTDQADPTTLRIQIESPTNKTYKQNSILLNVSFYTHENEARRSYIAYTIFNETTEFTDGILFNGSLSQTQPIWQSTTIEKIPDGNYTLRVTGFHIVFRWLIHSDQEFVNFIINCMPPEITILSPENRIYYSNNINLTYQYNEEISKASYCLDQNKNVTFTKHIILEDLADGEHELIIYAKDLAGNEGVSETTYFTIMEPFPTTQVSVIIITILAGLGILSYFKKRRS